MLLISGFTNRVERSPPRAVDPFVMVPQGVSARRAAGLMEVVELAPATA
jgi:hypothetical protein